MGFNCVDEKDVPSGSFQRVLSLSVEEWLML